MKNKTSQSGFTLIELIAVMVILAILAAVVIPRITTVQEGAYESNVVNMHGALRNYISNKALKNAITGGRGMETYDEPTETVPGYYLEDWIKDYDRDKWTQSQSANGGTTGNGTNTTPDRILFKYEPHGAGQGVLKDIYWIEYFPTTSASAAADAYTWDTFELIAYKDDNGSGQDDGSFTRGNEIQISGAVIDGP